MKFYVVCNPMKFYVFYIRGQNAVTETGVAECDTMQEAREFVAKLDGYDSWTIVEGKVLDSRNILMEAE